MLVRSNLHNLWKLAPHWNRGARGRSESEIWVYLKSTENSDMNERYSSKQRGVNGTYLYSHFILNELRHQSPNPIPSIRFTTSATVFNLMKPAFKILRTFNFPSYLHCLPSHRF